MANESTAADHSIGLSAHGRLSDRDASSSGEPSIAISDPVLSGASVDNIQHTSAETSESQAPKSWAEARTQLGFFSTQQLKALLKATQVRGLSNAPLGAKIDAVGARMVQHGLSTKDLNLSVSAAEAFENARQDSAGELFAPPPQVELDAYRKISGIPPATARVEKGREGTPDKVIWKCKNGPRLTDDGLDIVPNTLYESATASAVLGASCHRGPVREPPFTASEYARLMHCLADPRMMHARALIATPRDRDELDREPICPWTQHIAPLFNSERFTPPKVTTYVDGITMSDVSAIEPSEHFLHRDGSVLSRKWSELKSLYTVVLSKYSASGQGDPDCFPHFVRGRTYVMYLHVFLDSFPILGSLATRLIPESAQRECGVGPGVRPPSDGNRTRGRKRQNPSSSNSISITGLEGLSSVLAPSSPKSARRSEAAEAVKKEGEAVCSVLKAMENIENRIEASSSPNVKEYWRRMWKKLQAKVTATIIDDAAERDLEDLNETEDVQ
jgi:hypothetical protein